MSTFTFTFPFRFLSCFPAADSVSLSVTVPASAAAALLRLIDALCFFVAPGASASRALNAPPPGTLILTTATLQLPEQVAARGIVNLFDGGGGGGEPESTATP